ncbi:recombination protein RecO [Nitratifractor sp.]
MKGFILRLRRAKNEDLILTVLTEEKMADYYRFYGARHSILQLGYCIDFEEERDSGPFLPRLRRVSQIPFHWLYSRNRLMLWQRFVQLFEPHLRDTQTLERFYFDLLFEAARRWERQNPKRIVCETHYALLRHEGRLHPLDRCYICERPLEKEVALMQALIPAHPGCIYGSALPREKLETFFDTGKTTWLDDDEVERLYTVSMRGL